MTNYKKNKNKKKRGSLRGAEVSLSGWIANVGKQLVASAAAGDGDAPWPSSHLSFKNIADDRIQTQMSEMPETWADPSGTGTLNFKKKKKQKFSCTSSLFPPSHLWAFSHRQSLCRHFARKHSPFHPTAGIPSLDLILEADRNDRNVAKKRMVSVVTNTTPAIVRSDVGSQVPHLQSLQHYFQSGTVHLRTPCTPQTIAGAFIRMCVSVLAQKYQVVFSY